MLQDLTDQEMADKVLMLAMFEGALGNDSLETTMKVLADGGEQRWTPAIEVLHIAISM